MRRTMVRLLALVIVNGATALSQEALYTLKVNVPWVLVDVTVTDSNGRTVSDLKTEDFQILENGVPQSVQSFTPISAPYNVLLLFDRSGSTEHKWSFMLRAAAGFVANLRPQDRIAIDSFDFEYQPFFRWTYRRDLSVTALSDLARPGRSIGGTALYAAIETALKNEFKNARGRRAVVVLTDGRETSVYNEIVAHNRLLPTEDDRRFQRTLKVVRECRVPIYFVAINTDLNLDPNMKGGDEYRNLQSIFPKSSVGDDYLREIRVRMEMIASESGGRVLYPNSMEDVVPLYEKISRELGTAYSLGYMPSDSRLDGGLRRIEIRVADGTLHLSQSRTAYVAK